MYEHDFGIGTHIAEEVLPLCQSDLCFGGAKKTKQMSAQPKKGVLSWIPYEMHSTLILDKARCMARLRGTHAHCNSFNPPEKRWGHRRGRGVGRAHVVPRPPPFLRPSAGPQRRSMGAPSSAHLPRGELKHPPIGCSLGERFSSGLRSTVVLTQN